MMDSKIRKLQRDKAVDPEAEARYLAHLKRIGRNALMFTGPIPPPPKPVYPHQIDKALRQADPWCVGTKGFGKQAKSRAHRRMGKTFCRDWEDYW